MKKKNESNKSNWNYHQEPGVRKLTGSRKYECQWGTSSGGKRPLTNRRRVTGVKSVFEGCEQMILTLHADAISDRL